MCVAELLIFFWFFIVHISGWIHQWCRNCFSMASMCMSFSIPWHYRLQCFHILLLLSCYCSHRKLDVYVRIKAPDKIKDKKMSSSSGNKRINENVQNANAFQLTIRNYFRFTWQFYQSATICSVMLHPKIASTILIIHTLNYPWYVSSSYKSTKTITSH